MLWYNRKPKTDDDELNIKTSLYFPTTRENNLSKKQLNINEILMEMQTESHNTE